MTEKIKKGDLVIVTGIPEIDGQICVVLVDPYPAVFTSTIPTTGINLSEETQASDLMCSGKIYPKVRCELLFKVKVEQQESSRL